MKRMTEHSSEIAIVGGGMVGSTLALALARSGLSVSLIDSEKPDVALAPAFDGRASAIAAGAQHVLATLGAWPGMASHAAPILDIRVTDGDSPLFLHYDHRALGDEPLGFIVENRWIRHGLLNAVRAEPGIKHLAPMRIRPGSMSVDGHGVRLDLADGGAVRAQLVIAADGRDSALRRQAGIAVTGWRYGQSAIVCTIAHEKPHRGVAHERFLPSGPFAILPLSGNRSSIVWTERAELVPAILAQEEAAFLSELSVRFGDIYGALSVEGPRFSYPLALQLAERYTAPRMVLVGDAAHLIHPIAGQGLNLGLRDVAALAEILVDARRLGLDLGAAHVLSPYEQWRRFDTLMMTGLTDVMNRLFLNDLVPVRMARDLGLAAVERIGPLKKVLMRHAMGMVGDLPRLMRGEAL
jgi:2-octaprenyl-6-methoxyphenol hydroxylase